MNTAGVTVVQPPPMAQVYVPPGGSGNGPPSTNNNINPHYVYPSGPPGGVNNNMYPSNTNTVVRGTYIGTNHPNNNNMTTSVVVGVPL